MQDAKGPDQLFQRALAEGEILLPKCDDCRAYHFSRESCVHIVMAPRFRGSRLAARDGSTPQQSCAESPNGGAATTTYASSSWTRVSG